MSDLTERARTVSEGDDQLASFLANRMAGLYPVPDEAFDRVYPEHLRRFSLGHWSSVRLAMRAAWYLAPTGRELVLDVGSGVGKLCVVGALTTGARFVGVEHQQNLVIAARQAAARLRVPVTFHVRDAFDLDWERFDSIFFYNPFAESLLDPALRSEPWQGGGQDEFYRCVRAASQRLAKMAPGTRIVTYRGMGADLPAEYAEVVSKEVGHGQLQLWIKTSDSLRALSGVGCSSQKGTLRR